MKKINARDCSIVDMSNNKDEVKRFLEENHVQKSTRFTKAYGLYHKDRLVQVMTFGKPRFNKNFQWELLRDCTKKEHIVRGGISKLWNRFVVDNAVTSCVCYSYPHNDALYTGKYVEHCGFNTVKKAKRSKKIYFEGQWNGDLKRIDKSILERHGVDRLLKGDFGHDRTNEQILLDLGFEKKEEDGLDPQVDSYFPFGVLYRIDDLDDGSFYIGETTNKEKWNNGYLGSGTTKWANHKKAHPPIETDPDNPNAHHYERTILKDDFLSPKDLYESEVKEIRKHCVFDGENWKLSNKKCMNTKTSKQWSVSVCEECGAICGHKFTCSKYVPVEPCQECGKRYGHKKTCSQYPVPKSCPECGGKRGQHKKTCSKRKKMKSCPECGGIDGKHKKPCSRRKQIGTCSECGGLENKHRKGCSKRTLLEPCIECGGLQGQHKSGCSLKTISVCSECGGKNRHYKTCSQYNELSICDECGGKGGHHLKSCSCFKMQTPCPECGSYTTHKKSCSKHKTIVCPECGGKYGRHYKICSHYHPQSVCNECGRVNGHKKSCSRYSAPKPCPECGTIKGHTKRCSHYARNHKKCTETKDCKGSYHLKGCPKYKGK